MGSIQRLLNKAFPLMALAGLLMAGYGLLVTPDEMKSNVQLPRLTAQNDSAVSNHLSPLDN